MLFFQPFSRGATAKAQNMGFRGADFQEKCAAMNKGIMNTTQAKFIACGACAEQLHHFDHLAALVFRVIKPGEGHLGLFSSWVLMCQCVGFT
jgi:hypothetical protein